MIKFNVLSFLGVVGTFILKLGKLKVSVQEDPRRDISKSNTIFDNHLFI